MGDANFTVNLKAIMDISDVKHNVDQIQQKFNNLNISPKLKDSLNKDLNNFYKEYNKYTTRVENGIKTQADYNATIKSLDSMDRLYQKIGKDAEKIAGIKPAELFKDTPQLANLSNTIANLKKEFANLKVDPAQITDPLNQIKAITTNTKAKGLVDAILGANAKGDFETVLEKAKELETYVGRATAVMHDSGKAGDMRAAMGQVTQAIVGTTTEAGNLQKKITDTERAMESAANSMSRGAKEAADGFSKSQQEVNKLTESLKRTKTEEFGATQQIQMLDRQILRYFTLGQTIREISKIAKDAWQTVKELDKSMTETAVVTNFSVGDMWEKLPMYTDTANQLGSTIKDVYDATTLYYQQGLNTNQAMGVATETLKMARIGGLQAAEATDMMTAALRGFNMQINEMSAQRINDVYSKLAAITASNTEELGSAMTRTASIASSAGMEFETTSAFLAQMIETTREAPENLGTAMKTIVARFQEMKKAPEELVDSEGELLDANRVEKALKTIGVALRDTQGNFRDLDQVFLEISAKWNTLSMGQQRYIATMAAGSRQQSRFIAMMSNHERVMELVNAANNSAGASEEQFNKTLDSMEAKLNQFHNAWNEFAMSMMNSSFAKGLVDTGTTILGIINKIVSAAGKIAPDPFKGITKSLVALTAVTSTFKLGKGLFGLIREPLARFGASAIGLKGSDPYGITDMLTDIGKDARDKGIKIGKDLKDGIRSSLQGGNGLLQREFSLDQMLGLKNIDLSKYADEVNTQLNEALNKHFFDSDTGDETAARGLISKITTDLRNNRGDLAKEDFNTLVKDYGISPETLKTLKLTDEDFKKITDSAQRAGDGIYRFGAALQGTPLAPFGQALMKIGSFMNMFDKSAKKAVKSVLEFSKARLEALKSGGKEGELGDMPMSGTAKAGIAIAIITALVAAWVAGVQKMKEQERELQTVAAGASEAFSSARQETSELKDKLDQLETSESAFDGLVAGSVEFEEKLADVNSKIDELIKMYPQLESLGYVKIDNNGLKSITQEGKDYILEYQKEIENTAGALNTLATGELNAQKKRKEADKVKMPAKTTERSYDKLHAFSQETDESKEARKPYLQEQKDIKAEAETIRKTSQANAIKSTLTQEHLSNVENLTSIMAERYEDMSKQTEESLGDFSTHKKDYYEAYADALGYSYEGGKLFNAQHEEVEVDEKTVEQGAIRALTISQIEVDAKALDSAFYEINNAAKKQLKISGEGSDSFISDIMGRNTEVNQKALEQSLKDNGKVLKDFVDEMSDEEVALQVGVDLDTFKQDEKGYRKQLKDTLIQAASDTQDAVSKQYGDLGVMMLRAQGQTLVGATAGVDEGRGELTQVIQAKISELTAAQRSFAATVGQGLQENLGVDSMSIFMNQYIGATKEAKKEISSVLKGVDFSSSIETLGAFTKLSQNTTKGVSKEVQKLGKDLLDSADSAHLLGSAMEEVQTSESWAEVAKNMDKYVNSAGELDASGVEKMAAECGPLNDLLNTGAINASGFAMALDALEGSGVDSLSQINTSVLQLLSSFASLDGVMSNAHNTVANFNAGVDTGEVEDFMQENVDKIKEFINNGEWGNDELQTRVKSIVGVDAWNKALKDSGGNLEKAIKSFNIGKNFKEGFDTAWDNISSGKGIKNGQLVNVDEIKGLNKEIQGSWKYLSDGSKQWQLDVGNATTEQVVEWLQKVYEVNESTAEMMLTDFENYSAELKTELQTNDLTATMKNGEFYENNTLEGTSTSVLSKSNLELLAKQTNTVQDYDKLVAKFEKYADKNGKTFRVFNNQNGKGELSTNWDVLNKRLSALAEGNKTKDQEDIYAWLKPFTQGKTIDVDKSMAQATQAGATDEQVQNMLYRAFRDLTSQGQEFEYNGEKLDASEISTYDDFINKLSTIDQNAEWTQVGEAIASGYLNYVKSQEQPEQKRVNDFNDIGVNEGEQERINEAQVELDAAFNNTNVAQGAEQLAQIKEQLDLSGHAAGLLNEQFVALNATSLSQLSDTELLKVWESLGYGETEIDTIRAKLEGHPFVYETKLTGDDLEQRVDEIDNLTSKRREILLDTSLTGTQKVSALLDELGETFGKGDKVKKTAIIEAETKFANGDKEGGLQALLDAGFTDTEAESISRILEITYDGSIANPEQLKEALNEQIDKTVDEAGGKKKKIKKDVEVIGTTTTINKTKGKKQKKEKAWNVTNTISTVVSGAQDVTKLTGLIKKVPLKTLPKVVASVSGEGALTSLKNKLDSLPLVKTVKTIFRKVTTKEKEDPDDYRGQGNTGTVPSIPAGSLARGTKKLGTGQVGPNGQGGPTLTGELGYEVAWLPSEGKSMIVGANGPQMIDLPKNAVVWNHEQSKKILKQKSIPIGSQATGKKRGGTSNYTVTNTTHHNDTGGGKPKKSKESKEELKWNKKRLTYLVKVDKLLEKAGKISTWWENISKQVAAAERLTSKNQKALEKTMSTIGKTWDDVSKYAGKYADSLKLQIKYNTEIFNKYDKQLKNIDKGNKLSTKTRDTYIKNANATSKVTKKNGKKKRTGGALGELNRLQVQLAAAEKTASKKDDKAIKKKIKRLKNSKKYKKALDKINKNSSLQTVSWDQDMKVRYKTNKSKGKWKTKKTKVKQTRAIDFSKLIYQDPETGEYLINGSAINKKGKTKAERKAIKDKAQKLVDEQNKRRNDAQDKIEAAQEALDKLSEDLYNTFLGWENELTKIYMLSKKIESAQGVTSELENAQNLQESMLQSGLQSSTEKFAKESTALFGSIIGNNLSIIKMNNEQIKNQKQAVQDAINIGAIDQRIRDINDKIRTTTNTEQLGMYQTALKKANEEKEVAQLALKYVTPLARGDGTYSFNFDSIGLEKDILKGNINEPTGKAITDRINKMIEESDNLTQLYSDQLEALQNMYSTLSDLKEQYADYADELVEAVDEANQKEIDRLSKLSDTLSEKLKDLLDTVKRRLEQRRQAEDNAKTENDIAKKQQRLATLQADTSGGHASEIAQLQQEIAEAQQSYGRTLEDQTLQRLEEQADEAAKQRERMIALLEASTELAKNNGNNIALVNQYLANPTAYKAEIEELWRQNKEYYDQPLARQQVMDGEFETFFNGISTLPQEITATTDEIKILEPYVKTMAETVGTLSNNTGGTTEVISAITNLEEATTDAIAASLKQLLGSGNITLSDIVTTLSGYFGDDQESIIEVLKKMGMTPADFKKAGIPADIASKIFNQNWTKLFKGGYNADELREAGALTKDLVQVAKDTTKKGQSVGAKYQSMTGASSQTTQKALTAAGITGTAAMSGVSGKMDSNGKKKKGGVITTHISTPDKNGKVKEVGNKGSTLYSQNYNASKGTGTGKVVPTTIDKLTVSQAKANQIEARQAVEYAITHQKPGTKINANMQKIISALGIANKGYKLQNGVNAHLGAAGTLWWGTKKGINYWDTTQKKEPGFTAYNKKKFKEVANKLKKEKKTNTAKYIEYAQSLKANGITGYKTGGLATTTGPAWLDGTRAKPEAVLNATDTKNFIALKDILSDVMGHITDNNTTTYGDSTYEININVDHLNNDYDVDKVAKRVEKIITEDASYRNVTMVRKFR